MVFIAKFEFPVLVIDQIFHFRVCENEKMKKKGCFLGLALRLTRRFVPTYLCVRVCETNLFFVFWPYIIKIRNKRSTFLLLLHKSAYAMITYYYRLSDVICFILSHPFSFFANLCFLKVFLEAGSQSITFSGHPFRIVIGWCIIMWYMCLIVIAKIGLLKIFLIPS